MVEACLETLNTPPPRKKYAKKTQLFSVALADEIELLVEEDKALMKKILGIENNENDFELIPQEIEEAISALEVLGYSRKQTTKLVSKIKSDDPEISTEALIKRSLNNL